MHIILRISKHYGRVLELILQILDELGEKPFVVPYLNILSQITCLTALFFVCYSLSLTVNEDKLNP